MASRKSPPNKTAIVLASGLALTGAESVGDVVSGVDEQDLLHVATEADLDIQILDVVGDELFLPPLTDAEDEVRFDERYAQTWGGGTGNDGVMRAPGGGDRRIMPTAPDLQRDMSTTVRPRQAPKAQIVPKVREPLGGDQRSRRRNDRKKK